MINKNFPRARCIFKIIPGVKKKIKNKRTKQIKYNNMMRY